MSLRQKSFDTAVHWEFIFLSSKLTLSVNSSTPKPFPMHNGFFAMCSWCRKPSLYCLKPTCPMLPILTHNVDLRLLWLIPKTRTTWLVSGNDRRRLVSIESSLVKVIFTIVHLVLTSIPLPFSSFRGYRVVRDFIGSSGLMLKALHLWYINLHRLVTPKGTLCNLIGMSQKCGYLKQWTWKGLCINKGPNN